MDKNKKCFGIDISKVTFDVYTESLGGLPSKFGTKFIKPLY